MGRETAKEKEKKQRKGRGPKWSLWETCCVINVVVTIRDNFCQCMSDTEMMCEFNRHFADLVDDIHKNNLCVDHHGFQDSRVSLEA